MFKPVIPILEKALIKSNTHQIIDLGSGGGGLLWINSELKKRIPDLKIILTDYYPNISAFKFIKAQSNNFEYIEKSIDARNVPTKLKGLRTQFLSFHHFRKSDAQLILRNAFISNASIAIFEAQERSVKSMLAMIFSPLTVLLVTPFIKPFKIGRIVFTYIIPIVPLFVLWDGIVSCLRTYSVKEMKELIKSIDDDSYDWEVDRMASGPGVILYLLGSKKK
ncbi:hypothetical protein ABW636_11635 [Aquimarina sp. 2201CG1-2-11]|uniref:hypothetical protein n=1 Tax=Aquimarina discodermiae TaxID=3231043 RepID=UPI003462665F